MTDLNKVDTEVKAGAEKTASWIKDHPWLAVISAAALLAVIAVLAFKFGKLF